MLPSSHERFLELCDPAAFNQLPRVARQMCFFLIDMVMISVMENAKYLTYIMASRVREILWEDVSPFSEQRPQWYLYAH